MAPYRISLRPSLKEMLAEDTDINDQVMQMKNQIQTKRFANPAPW